MCAWDIICLFILFDLAKHRCETVVSCFSHLGVFLYRYSCSRSGLSGASCSRAWFSDRQQGLLSWSSTGQQYGLPGRCSGVAGEVSLPASPSLDCRGVAAGWRARSRCPRVPFWIAGALQRGGGRGPVARESLSGWQKQRELWQKQREFLRAH